MRWLCEEVVFTRVQMIAILLFGMTMGVMIGGMIVIGSI